MKNLKLKVQEEENVFARIEVAMRPQFTDPAALGLLRRAELAHPEIRRKIRWARMIDIYWLDIPATREEVIPAVTGIFWDHVLQWLFTGNLIPSASGKNGGIPDLYESAPIRPGVFWALERRYRPGVTDNVGRTVIEAFEIVLKKKLPDARAASGSLLLLEGPDLDDEALAILARDVFCNELVETWTAVPSDELKKNDRFHQERIKRDLPKMNIRKTASVETINIQTLDDKALDLLSKKKLWALTVEEMKVVKAYFQKRGTDPTDVEMEIIAQTWSEHCKHKIFSADIDYSDTSKEEGAAADIPRKISSLFKTTIVATTEELKRPWLLSVFHDNAGIVALDDDDALCIKVETHNSPSALDPYGGALTGIVGVNRDILGCGLGARPIFNTDVFCVAPLDYSSPLPDRIFHPRRILDGIRRGVEHGGNKSGIPTVNGALVFDDRYLGKPLVYCGTAGLMPRKITGRDCFVKEIEQGDLVVMVGGRVGKDGIHGATFSSLALDETSPLSAVQLGDPITQKRMADFLLEARDRGLYRALTDNGAGGLSSSIGELARLCGVQGGARIDVALAKTKYPGLRPYELVVSESQERMSLAVPKQSWDAFAKLADDRGVEVSALGEFGDTGFFEIQYEGVTVGKLDLEFLHNGNPKLKLEALWEGRTEPKLPPPGPKGSERTFENHGQRILLDLLGRPNIASKEWLIRQYDHEVQGASVVKPLHISGLGTDRSFSGPNDAGVIKPKATSDVGIAVGCGINPKLSDVDPYLMAQSAVDEAIRNILCVGAEFGRPESVVALVDNFCWPDPVNDKAKAAALVRSCYGLKHAALALGVPLVSGKDSMKNDFKGTVSGGKPVKISVPPTLLMTAVAKVVDVKFARTADFKSAGDIIYLLGGNKLGLMGSEFQNLGMTLSQPYRLGEPDWDEALRIYRWIGGSTGKESHRLRSLHDVSDGGVLVAVVEGLLARGLGGFITVPEELESWEFAFGEGFHSFVASVGEADSASVEAELSSLDIPFRKIGTVMSQERLDVAFSVPGGTQKKSWSIPIRSLRAAWQKGGYWE